MSEEEFKEFKEFKETSGWGATLDCKLKRLAQKMALIERVAMAVFLNSLNFLNSLKSSSLILVQSVTR